MAGTESYVVKKSSWLMPLWTAVFLGAVALGIALLPLLIPVADPALLALVILIAVANAVIPVWLFRVGLRTRRCGAILEAEHLDLTSFRLVRGRGTRRLASARIPWADVQSLVSEGYDLVGGAGWRMELRNLFVFSRQGDFVLYGFAWRDWDALVAAIVARSGRELDVPAAERAADIENLNRHVRRNFRLLRVMSWISLGLLLLMLVAGIGTGFTAGTSDRWLWVALLVAPLLWAIGLRRK